jgi:hypothetical protein
MMRSCCPRFSCIRRPTQSGRRCWREPQTQEAIQLIERGAHKQVFHYPIKYEDGPRALLPHLSKARALCRLICAEAIRQTEADHCVRAWELIESALYLVDLPRHEPILISQLVRYALVEAIIDTMDDVAHFGVPNAHRFALIDQQLQALSGEEPLFRALQGERVIFYRWYFEHTPELLGLKDSFEGRFAALAIQPWVIASQAEMESFIMGYRPPALAQRKPPTEIWLYHEHAPAMGKVWVKHRYFEQSLHMTRVAVAMQREFQEGGSYPSAEVVAERRASGKGTRFMCLGWRFMY